MCLTYKAAGSIRYRPFDLYICQLRPNIRSAMIQRVQTVYLFLAFACMVLLLFFPIFSFNTTYQGTDGIGFSNNAQLDAYGMHSDQSVSHPYAIYLIFISCALLTGACALLFKNRKNQIRLTYLNLLIHFIVLIVFYCVYFWADDLLLNGMSDLASEDVHIKINLESGFFLLNASLPFVLLALMGMRRDDKLVRSLDRLR